MKKLIVSVAITAISFVSFSQVGIGTNTPNSSAALDVFSTTKGFLPPRMTAAQLATLTLTAPATGLIAYCTDCAPQGVFVFNGVSFINLIDNAVIKPITENIVRSTTGRIWMDRNLGAKQVATSAEDHLAYGGLYQWGRPSDGHQYINWISSTSSDDVEQNFMTAILSVGSNPGNSDFITNSSTWEETPDITLWQGINGLNNPCPAGFRIPTKDEWNAEKDNGGSGFWGTGSAISDNSGPFLSVLKLPENGQRAAVTGELKFAAEFHSVWTSTTIGNTNVNLFVTFNTPAGSANRAKGLGAAVRCIKD